MINIEGEPPRPIADPALLTVAVGEPVRFTCHPNSESPAVVTWSYREPGGPLRGDVYQQGNHLIINSASLDDSGDYICKAVNQFGSADAAPVRLHVVERK